MRIKLGESNELKFLLSIKGVTSDPSATKPTIRFLVTEDKTGMSMCFPMNRVEEGMVGVTIPDIPEVFQEGTEYTGLVEVIVGNRYFNPTKVGLVFEREMQVEAQPVITEEPTPTEEESTEPTGLDDGFLKSVLFSEKKAPPPQPKPVSPKQDPRRVQAKTRLKKMFMEAWDELET